MANVKKKKGVIGILTGGGDVPGLNPAIRAVTIRAIREGYQVIGLRRGWAGLMELIRNKKVDNSNHYQILTEEIVNKADQIQNFVGVVKPLVARTKSVTNPGEGNSLSQSSRSQNCFTSFSSNGIGISILSPILLYLITTLNEFF